MIKITPIIIIITILIGILSSSVFTIYETNKAIMTQLGKLKIDNKTLMPKIYNPGLHFKIPMIQNYIIFDMRIKLLDVQSSRITTKEKKDVLVDFYILWQIDDLPLYYTRASGNKIKSEQLLKQKVIASLKAEFGKKTIKEVVHGERLELMARLKELSDESTKNMGISITDVRIKRIDLPDEVRESVYLRMRAERERVASETRATGRAEALKIRAMAEKEQRIILAKALKEAKEIKGKGDAEAISIYAKTYNKDINFYEFYKSIEAYQEIFKSKNDILLINPDGDFFKYFNKKYD